MIQANQLQKIYRGAHNEEVRAVDNVSFSVDSGRFAVLTGPSGSGKTTLLSLLGLLARPTSGSVILQGRDLRGCTDFELARMRRDIGFVFQNFSLLPRLPVWENVTYPLIPRGVRTPERLDVARRVLRRLNMESKLESRPEQLSGGEQQRVAVARAIASEPKLLLADEPTSNLDQRAATELADLFQELHASGVTLVFSTHSPALIESATDVFRLQDGQLVAE